MGLSLSSLAFGAYRPLPRILSSARVGRRRLRMAATLVGVVTR
jgi:hypothetical protein